MLTSCNNLLQKADIRMRSHGCENVGLLTTSLLQVDCHKKACQGVSTSCNKPDFNNLMKLTSLLQLIDKLQKAGKTDNLQQICGVCSCIETWYRCFERRHLRTSKCCFHVLINKYPMYTLLYSNVLTTAA